MLKTKIVSILALILIAGMAQAGNGKRGPERMPGMMGGNGGGVERMIGHLSRAADELQISDEQLDQMFALVDASRGDLRTVKREMRENQKALRTTSGVEPYDGDAVAAIAASQGELTTRMIILSSRVRADVLAILTPEQRDRIREFRENRRGKRGRR